MPASVESPVRGRAVRGRPVRGRDSVVYSYDELAVREMDACDGIVVLHLISSLGQK